MEEPKIHLIDDYIKQFRKVVVKQVSEDSIFEVSFHLSLQFQWFQNAFAEISV